jgi:hypothetical protein
MPDMLVKLYEIPPLHPTIERLAPEGVVVRRALTPDRPRVLAWVDAHFAFWKQEVEACFGRVPVSCFLAVRGQELIGFACYDSICPNFFGPTAVLEAERGKHVGRALLLAALHAKNVGAVMIEGSQPGIYDGLLF